MKSIGKVNTTDSSATTGFGKLQKVIGQIGIGLDRVLGIKRFKTLEQATQERGDITKLVEHLMEQEAEADIVLAKRATEASGIEIKPLDIRGDIFVKRQEDCLNVYDRIKKIQKVFKKKFNNRIANIPPTNDTIIAQTLVLGAMKQITDIVDKEITFKLIDERSEVTTARRITNPIALINFYYVIGNIINNVLNDPAYIAVLATKPITTPTS